MSLRGEERIEERRWGRRRGGEEKKTGVEKTDFLVFL
jgi:hypothetical protein